MQVVEAPLPRLLPWLKPGLANSTTLVALLLFGLPSALLLVLVRQVAANLLMGTFLAPSFFLGWVGASVAGITMALALYIGRQQLGLVSISAIGALSSNLGQLVTAAYILDHYGVWYQLPLMMGASVPAGILIGLLSALLLQHLPKEMTKTFTHVGKESLE